jgi:hypothetical protein
MSCHQRPVRYFAELGIEHDCRAIVLEHGFLIWRFEVLPTQLQDRLSPPLLGKAIWFFTGWEITLLAFCFLGGKAMK